MFRVCKHIVPVIQHGKFALRPTVQRNFWGLPSTAVGFPRDFRFTLRDIDRQINNFEREIQSFFRNSPLVSLIPRSLPLEAAEITGNTYRINIDVSGFKPEDIKLSLKDRVLTVEGKMESKSEDGSRLYQEMSRLYTLPESVEIENLKSLLTSDGILAIEAPITPGKEGTKPKEIPINRTEEIAAK